jgi:hypothetical protein
LHRRADCCPGVSPLAVCRAENILSLDLADDRLYWLRHENPDLILEAY